MPDSHSIVRIRGLTSQSVVGQPQGLQSLPKPTVLGRPWGLPLSAVFRPLLAADSREVFGRALLRGLFAFFSHNPTHPPLRHL